VECGAQFRFGDATGVVALLREFCPKRTRAKGLIWGGGDYILLLDIILMRRALIILSVLVVVVGAWAYLFTGTPPWGPPFKPKDAAVTSVELYWLGTTRTIGASDQCAKVVQTMRKARQSLATTSPSFGTLTLYYADGTTNRFWLEPSGRFSGLEFGDDSGSYAISMLEMLGTLESVGLLTKERK